MIETMITIILAPVAIAAVIFSAALIAGVVKYFKQK